MKNKRYPNLYIIGSPKCGTTSIADWLRENDEIYVPPNKEPHHFNTDHNFLVYAHEKDYIELYQNKNETYLCDASVWYLYSQVAVPNILEKSDACKFVVCLRNPLEMAVSLYLEQKYATNEHLENFFEAWESSVERRVGKNVSKWCREPLHLDYQSACLVGMQVSRLFEHVSKERVHFVFLDDIKADSKLTYNNLLKFLGLPLDGRLDFNASNSAKSVKYKWGKRFVRVLGMIRKKIPLKSRFGLLNYLNKINVKAINSKPVLSSCQKEKMIDFYKSDIELLSQLTGKNLSHWIPKKND